MGKILPVAAEAGITTIKDGRRREVVGVREPVPVRRVALVAAFLSQDLLVRPSEVSMPREEVSLKKMLLVMIPEISGDVGQTTYRAVNGRSLVDMHNNKVVISILCARKLEGIRL